MSVHRNVLAGISSALISQTGGYESNLLPVAHPLHRNMIQKISLKEERDSQMAFHLMFSCLSASPEWKWVEIRADIEREHPSDFDRLDINELYLTALKMPAQLGVK